MIIHRALLETNRGLHVIFVGESPPKVCAHIATETIKSVHKKTITSLEHQEIFQIIATLFCCGITEEPNNGSSGPFLEGAKMSAWKQMERAKRASSLHLAAIKSRSYFSHRAV